MSTPEKYKFTKTDEWVNLEGGIATIGISDYAQQQLSDVVFMEATVSAGDQVKRGATIASIESVKAAADVTLPVSGKVVAVNEDLPGSPDLVNSDPYGKAWILKVEVFNPAELNDLMDSAAYQTYCAERSN